MPFVDLTDIESLIPNHLADALAEDVEGEARFVAIEAQAAQIITDYSGVAAPGSIEDRPTWVIVPMAWLVKKLANYLLSDQSEPYQAEVEKDYRNALDLIARHKTAPAEGTAPNSFSGLIESKGDHIW